MGIKNKISSKRSKTHLKDTKECLTRKRKGKFIKYDCRANFSKKQQFTNCIGFINDKISVLIAINEPSKEIV